MDDEIKEQGRVQPNLPLRTLSKIKQFHVDGIYWDVQLEVDTKVFKCQRSILAANSEYFDTMFRSINFKESNANANANQPITLPQLDATTFEQILHFMYTGDIPVNDSNVLQLLVMSDFLRLSTNHVEQECLRYVKSRSREDEPMSNAFGLLCFASLKEENALVDTMHAHICRHVYHYSEDKELSEISFENLNALLGFCRSYVLPSSGSADVVLKIIHNWVNRKREERTQYRCKLMENVDVANVSSDFAVSLINRLENAVDEVLNLSSNIKSFSDLKTFEMAIDIGQAGKDALVNHGLISLNVKNISEKKVDEVIHSASHIISNLSWKVSIQHDRDHYLGIFLDCDGTDSTSEWYCYASAIFTLKSQKEGREDFVGTIDREYFSSTPHPPCYRGLESFLKWRDLIDPKNGFVKDDNSITIETRVHVDSLFLN